MASNSVKTPAASFLETLRSIKGKLYDQAIELIHLTMAEDKEILVRVPQGLASRFQQPGPLASRDLEGTIRDFYQYLSRSLTTSTRAAASRCRVQKS